MAILKSKTTWANWGGSGIVLLLLSALHKNFPDLTPWPEEHDAEVLGAILAILGTLLARFARKGRVAQTKVTKSVARPPYEALVFLCIGLTFASMLGGCAFSGEIIDEETFDNGELVSTLHVERKTTSKLFGINDAGAGQWSYTASDGDGNEFEMRAGGRVNYQQAGDAGVLVDGLADLARIAAPFLVGLGGDGGGVAVDTIPPDVLTDVLEQITNGVEGGNVGLSGILDLISSSDNPNGVLRQLLGLVSSF